MSTEQLEENGQFWLSSDEEGEHAVHGRLEVSPNGIATLRVFSPLVADEKSLLSWNLDKKPYIRILGITESNRKVTLEDASASGIGSSYGTGTGVDTRNFSSDKVLIGALFEEKDYIRFFEVSFQLENVFEWFGMSGIREVAKSKFDEPYAVKIEYEHPPPIDFDWPDTAEAQVFFGLSDPGVVPWSPTWDFRQSCSITLRQKEDLWTVSDIEMIALSLQSFFSVVTGESVAITQQTVRCKGQSDKQLGREVEIQCLARSYINDNPSGNSKHPLLMPLQYKDLAEHFPEVLKRWNQMCERDEHAIRLMMASRFGRYSWQEHFLQLTKAVETSLGKELPDETTFRQVIKHTVEQFAQEFTKPVDVDTFADATTRYRNWFTHYDRKKRPIDVDFGEVRTLAYNLRGMLDLFLIAKSLPRDCDYRQFVYESGKLRWSLKRYLEPSAKHLKQA